MAYHMWHNKEMLSSNKFGQMQNADTQHRTSRAKMTFINLNQSAVM